MAAAMAACEESVVPQVSLVHAAYLSVHHRVFAVDYDLPGRRDHERRHHGRRLLPLQRRRAQILGTRDFGQLGFQLRRHGVYGGCFRCLCSVRGS